MKIFIVLSISLFCLNCAQPTFKIEMPIPETTTDPTDEPIITAEPTAEPTQSPILGEDSIYLDIVYEFCDWCHGCQTAHYNTSFIAYNKTNIPLNNVVLEFQINIDCMHNGVIYYNEKIVKLFTDPVSIGINSYVVYHGSHTDLINDEYFEVGYFLNTYVDGNKVSCISELGYVN